uniref:Uncharacterized protein n=1 Tax=Knipowitschia caucasica TaxID=637954 RepID=A0AAV2J8T4_KNICA
MYCRGTKTPPLGAPSLPCQTNPTNQTHKYAAIPVYPTSWKAVKLWATLEHLGITGGLVGKQRGVRTKPKAGPGKVGVRVWGEEPIHLWRWAWGGQVFHDMAVGVGTRQAQFQ